jgi:lipoprotein signal peptidase
MIERTYRGLFWGLVLGGLTLDQASKYGVFKALYNGGDNGELVLIPGAFKLLAQFSEQQEASANFLASLRTWSGETLPKVNHGALFGLGGEYVSLANAVFAVISVVAALAIAYWSTRRATVRDRALCAALGLILAGTLGNLYDRLVFNGVRDFLYFHLINWPVFNLADCCLVCGAGLLLTQAFWSQPVRADRNSSEAVLVGEAAETSQVSFTWNDAGKKQLNARKTHG